MLLLAMCAQFLYLNNNSIIEIDLFLIDPQITCCRFSISRYINKI